MSGGKKKHPKKRTYTEGEVRRMVKQCADDATKTILMLCATAARDQFDMDEDTFVEFMGRMQRYVDAEADRLVSIEDANMSMQKHGIDLRLQRW